MRLSLCLTAAVLAAALTSLAPGALAAVDPKCVGLTPDPQKLQACVTSLDERLRAQEEKPDDADEPDDQKKKDDSAARVASLEKQLADQQAAQAKLEARIAALESKPAPEGQVKDVPGGQTDPVALAQRVSALETRLSGDIKLKNLTVEGSLTVTDDSKTIFFVKGGANGDGLAGSEMYLGGEGGANFQVTASGDVVSAKAEGAAGGDNYAEMSRTDKGAQLNVHKGGSEYTMLGYDELYAGVQVADSTGAFAKFGRNTQTGVMGAVFLAGKNQLAALGVTQDGTSVMQLAQAGSKVAAVKEAASKDGGSIYLGANDKPVVELSAPEKRVAVLLSDGEGVAAELRKSKSAEGGNVSVYDASKGMRFSAGATSDDGGAACVFRKGNYLVTCLGIGLPGVGGGSQ